MWLCNDFCIPHDGHHTPENMLYGKYSSQFFPHFDEIFQFMIGNIKACHGISMKMIIFGDSAHVLYLLDVISANRR